MSKDLAMDRYLEANTEGRTMLEIRNQISKLMATQRKQEVLIDDIMKELNKLKEGND